MVSATQDAGSSVVGKLVESWIGFCEDYRKRERREIIEQEPSEAKLQQFRQELKWLLGSARHLVSLATDTEYPTEHDAEEIAWRVRQLEDSWHSLNNPMSAAEAESQLKKHFAGDPVLAKLLPG